MFTQEWECLGPRGYVTVSYAVCFYTGVQK